MIFRETQTGHGDGTPLELIPSVQLSPDHPHPDAQRRRLSTGAVMFATTGELLGLRDYIETHDGPMVAQSLLGDGSDVSAWNFTDAAKDVPPEETPRLVAGEAARQLARIATTAGMHVERVVSLSDVTEQTSLIEHTGPIPVIKRKEAPVVVAGHRAAQVDIGTGEMETHVGNFYD